MYIIESSILYVVLTVLCRGYISVFIKPTFSGLELHLFFAPSERQIQSVSVLVLPCKTNQGWDA